MWRVIQSYGCASWSSLKALTSQTRISKNTNYHFYPVSKVWFGDEPFSRWYSELMVLN